MKLFERPMQDLPRKSYIGSSDAPVLMAGTEQELIDLWNKKVHGYPADPERLPAPMAMGIATEGVNLYLHQDELMRGLAERHQHLNQIHFMLHPNPGTQTYDKEPYIKAHVDAWVDIAGEELCIIETKWKGSFSDLGDVIERASWQCQHHMLCTGAGSAALLILENDQPLDIVWFNRDPQALSMMVKTYREFWQSVVNKTEPSGNPIRMAPKPEPSAYGTLRIHELTEADNYSFDMIDYCSQWEASREAAKRHTNAKEQIKVLMPDDVRLLIVKDAGLNGVAVERSKSGSVLINELTPKIVAKHKAII